MFVGLYFCALPLLNDQQGPLGWPALQVICRLFWLTFNARCRQYASRNDCKLDRVCGHIVTLSIPSNFVGNQSPYQHPISSAYLGAAGQRTVTRKTDLLSSKRKQLHEDLWHKCRATLWSCGDKRARNHETVVLVTKEEDGVCLCPDQFVRQHAQRNTGRQD